MHESHPDTKNWTETQREEYLRESKPWLIRLCKNSLDTLGDPSYDVEDLTQEMSIVLIKAFDTYDPGNKASFKTYAHRVLANALTTKFRKIQAKKRVVARYTMPYDSGVDENGDEYIGADNLASSFNEEDGVEEIVIRREKLDHLRKALRESAPTPEDIPYIDYLLKHDKTQGEIAQSLGKSQALVSQAIANVINAVLLYLQDDPLFEEDFKLRSKKPRVNQKTDESCPGQIEIPIED